jgi:uncharacterized protein YcfJ
MKRLRMFGFACLILMMTASSAMAIPPGGVIRGGIRGAMVGGLIGGSRGAEVGRRVGAVAGGVRRANYRAYQRDVYRESQARAAYRATAPYRAGVHSNFYVTPRRVIVRPPVVVYP